MFLKPTVNVGILEATIRKCSSKTSSFWSTLGIVLSEVKILVSGKDIPASRNVKLFVAL